MARKYTDKNSREWTIDVHVFSAKRVKDGLGDKADLVDAQRFGDLFKACSTDPELLVNIIWFLVEPAAEKAGVSPEQFAMGLQGDALDDAADALMEATIDFFPGRQQPSLRKALAKIRETEAKAIEILEDHLDSEAVDEMVAKTLGNLSMNLQQSLESIPDPVLSEN